MPNRNNQSRGLRINLSPAQVIVLGFAALILFGAVLLTLPISSSDGKSVGFINALFTSTSAVCVTGLTVLDTATEYSLFGQIVILLLIQAGGLGIMTMSTLFAMIIGKRIGLKERLVIQEALGQFSLSGVVRLTRQIILVTLLIEVIGATILAIRFSLDFPVGRAVYLGVFHAVSAFNNAGFDLFTTSLTRFEGDWAVIPTISFLIILGGIGFTVIKDVWEHRRFSRLSLHSKLAIKVSLVLIVVGTILIYAFEASNPQTLGGKSFSEKLLGAYFHSVTPRTAGFISLPVGLMTSPTLLLTIVLMFIGASPGSTGGGTKTTTFGALVMAVRATISGRDEIILWGRRLTREVVEKGLAITMAALSLIVVMTMILMITEQKTFMEILFEVTSAFGTVGLSVGITPELTDIGKLLISFTMYVGRVGPLTLAVAIAQRHRAPVNVHYPEDRVVVG